MKKVLLFGVLLIAISLIIWSFGGRQKKGTAGVVKPASSATSLLVAKSDAGEGGITVAAQPVAVSGENIIFEFTIDTHSGDLTSFPILEKASLVFEGKEVLPDEWQETANSGHHRSGRLVFKIREIGEIGEMELKIKDLGGIPERRIEWTL